MTAKDRYQVREVDAYIYDDEWIYNQTFYLFSFTTSAKDTARAFHRALLRHGISFIQPHSVTAIYDGDVWEIVDRKTHEPLFVAIPEED